VCQQRTRLTSMSFMTKLNPKPKTLNLVKELVMGVVVSAAHALNIDVFHELNPKP
jgi:hypothetical protein